MHNPGSLRTVGLSEVAYGHHTKLLSSTTVNIALYERNKLPSLAKFVNYLHSSQDLLAHIDRNGKRMQGPSGLRWHSLTMVQTRKRVRDHDAGSESKRSKLRVSHIEQGRTESGSESASGRSITISGELKSSTSGTSVLGCDDYLGLHHAIGELNTMSKIRMCREVDDEYVQTQLRIIRNCVKQASESYERCFDYFEHALSAATSRSSLLFRPQLKC